MNRLEGTIDQIESDGALSLIDLRVGDSLLSALLVENSQSAPWMQTGTEVELLFKELEVAVASADLGGEISLRNHFLCTVESTRTKGLLSEVVFSFEGQRVHSLITTRSFKRLNLQAGEKAYWLIKANEIALKKVQR